MYSLYCFSTKWCVGFTHTPSVVFNKRKRLRVFLGDPYKRTLLKKCPLDSLKTFLMGSAKHYCLCKPIGRAAWRPFLKRKREEQAPPLPLFDILRGFCRPMLQGFFAPLRFKRGVEDVAPYQLGIIVSANQCCKVFAKLFSKSGRNKLRRFVFVQICIP